MKKVTDKRKTWVEVRGHLVPGLFSLVTHREGRKVTESGDGQKMTLFDCLKLLLKHLSVMEEEGEAARQHSLW